MSAKPEKFQRRRLQSSYLSVIISVSLVLFTLGILGVMILLAQKVTREVQQNIGMTLYLKADVSEGDVDRLKRAVEIADYTAEAVFISKDEAAELLKEDLGEDFMQYLDYNPLSASIELKVKPEYSHPDSLSGIKNQLLKSNKIQEVDYQASLAELVEKNIRRLGIIIGAFSLLLLIVAIALINNSIRLSIYSKRFLIKSMQLVGATQGFIRRPFVWKGILHGIYSAVIANLLIVIILYYSQQYLPELELFSDLKFIGSIFAVILFLGVLISWVSTSLAVRKFLKIRTEKIY